MNKPEATELAGVLARRFGSPVEVAGAADGAEVTIERGGVLHRLWVGEDVESSPLLRYLLLGHVTVPALNGPSSRSPEHRPARRL